MAEKLTIKINGDTKDYKKSLDEVSGSTGKLEENLGTLAKGTAIAFAGLTGAIVLAVNEAKKIESITTQFEVLTGSAQKASDLVKDLQEFSASTPFQFEGIAKASQQLLGFGFAADQMPDKLQKIGDVASAVGKPIDEIGFIFGQVSAAGKLTGERLLQFQERAIPIGPAIAKTMGVAEESVKDLVSAGKVDFATFEKAFASLSEEGGLAFEGMQKQSETLEGKLSTLKDNFSIFSAEIGKQLLPIIKLLVDRFTLFVQSMKESGDAAKTFNTVLSGTFKIAALLKAAFATLGGLIANSLATGIEAVNAAVSGNFKQAALITKEGVTEVGNIITDSKKQLNKDLEDIDAAFDQKQIERKEEKKNAAMEEAAVAAEEAKAIKQAEFDAELADLQNNEKKLTDEELRLLKEKVIKKKKADEVAKIQELKRQGKHDEALDKLRKLKTKRQIEEAEKRRLHQKQVMEVNIKATQNFLALAADIAKDGSKTQQNLLATNALISTYTAANQALSSPPGPPFTIPLVASIVGLGLANVAKIKGANFAEGGMFTGGIPGVDSINARVQQGEIVAPVQNFEEVIGSVRAKREAEELTGGESGGGMVQVHVSYDSPEASQIVTVRQVEDTSLGISQDSFKEAG